MRPHAALLVLVAVLAVSLSLSVAATTANNNPNAEAEARRDSGATEKAPTNELVVNADDEITDAATEALLDTELTAEIPADEDEDDAAKVSNLVAMSSIPCPGEGALARRVGYTETEATAQNTEATQNTEAPRAHCSAPRTRSATRTISSPRSSTRSSPSRRVTRGPRARAMGSILAVVRVRGHGSPVGGGVAWCRGGGRAPVPIFSL